MQDDEKKELIKNLTNQQGKLQQLTKSIAETFNETDKTTVSSDWLKDYVDKFYKRGKFTTTKTDSETAFFNIFEEFLEKFAFTEERKTDYRTVFNALKRFEIFQRTIKGDTDFVLDVHTISDDTLTAYSYLLHQCLFGNADVSCFLHLQQH